MSILAIAALAYAIIGCVYATHELFYTGCVIPEMTWEFWGAWLFLAALWPLCLVAQWWLSRPDAAAQAEGRRDSAVSYGHDWIKSTLGHGETMCRRCGVTNREAALLGTLDRCDLRAADQERDSAEDTKPNDGSGEAGRVK